MPSRSVIHGVALAFFVVARIATTWLHGAPLEIAWLTACIAYAIYMMCTFNMYAAYSARGEIAPPKVAGQIIFLAALPWLILLAPIGKSASMDQYWFGFGFIVFHLYVVVTPIIMIMLKRRWPHESID